MALRWTWGLWRSWNQCSRGKRGSACWECDNFSYLNHSFWRAGWMPQAVLRLNNFCLQRSGICQLLPGLPALCVWVPFLGKTSGVGERGNNGMPGSWPQQCQGKSEQISGPMSSEELPGPSSATALICRSLVIRWRVILQCTFKVIKQAGLFFFLLT